MRGWWLIFLVLCACSTTDADREEARSEAQVLAGEAEELMKTGELGDALARAEDALDEDPENMQAILVKSRCLEHLDRPVEALAILLKPCPGSVERVIRLTEAADVAMRMYQPSLAVVYLNRAMELDVDSARLFLLRGIAEAACSRELASKVSFNRAEELGGDPGEIRPHLARVLIVLEEYDEAAAMLEKQRRGGGLTAEETVLLGVVKCNQKLVAEGIALFQEAASKDENLVEAPFNEGQALEMLEDAAGAETAYRQAMRVDPGYAPAVYQLGRLLISQGRREEGLALVDNAIELEQDAVVVEALKKTRDDLVEASASADSL